MSPISFAHSPALSLGVELEIQLIDAKTFEMAPRALEILQKIGANPHITPELFQSMLEVKSRPCQNVHELRKDLKASLREVFLICKDLGIEIACSGTHPTANHWETTAFPHSRYEELIDRNQYISRQLLIFGVHVHIGVESGEMCIDLMNEFLYDLPILLALSASSPFWRGQDTGLASSRVIIFESSPTSGHPILVRDWADFQDLTAALMRSKAITSLKDLWWDVRPSPRYGTLEIRVCDGLPTLDENMAVTALIHCLATAYHERILAGHKRPLLPEWMVRENKWRASRHGVEADLVVNPMGDSRPLREYTEQLITELNVYFEKYDYGMFRDILRNTLKGYTSYFRQRAAFSESGDLKKVTQLLIGEMSSSLESP